MNIFRYPDYTRPTLHCSIENHTFFMTAPARNSYHFSVLLAAKHVDLILWLKVYVVFNDSHHLKILLCECQMSFKFGSLRCVKYSEKKPTQYQPLPLFWGTIFSPKYWNGIWKNWYLPGGLLCFLSKKTVK